MPIFIMPIRQHPVRPGRTADRSEYPPCTDSPFSLRRSRPAVARRDPAQCPRPGQRLPVRRLFRYDTVTARTLAIQVGIPNSGLAVAMALKYFPAIGALAALPGALLSIWHNLSCSVLAAWWSRDRGGVIQINCRWISRTRRDKTTGFLANHFPESRLSTPFGLPIAA